MVFDPHRKLTLSGTLGSSNEEQFSFGVNLDEALFSAAQDQLIFDDIVSDCVAFFARPATKIHADARLREVKVAKIGANGRYVADPLISLPLNVQGGSTEGNRYPPQIALAVSLVTARRGATGRGRFYLPMPTVQLQDNLGITPSFLPPVAASVKTWLDDLNNRDGAIPDAIKYVIVASSKGYNSPVTGVRLGRVYDTIRSRRGSLQEAYTATIDLS